MAKARIVALVIIGVMLLTMLMPQLAAAAFTGSEKPINLSPYDGAANIGPAHSFQVALPDPAPEVLYETEWQWIADGGSWALPLYDARTLGVVVEYPVGVFDYGQKYYWRVMAWDDLGHPSDWSTPTSFTVAENSPPSQPQNFEPDDGATGVSLSPTLQACEFRDPNALEVVLGETDTHAASQWQIAASGSHDVNPDGSYKNPVYDSDNVTTGLTSIVVPAAYLNGGASYYWHVKYKDSYGHWSAYSSETLFSTVASASGSAPAAAFSADKTEVVAGGEAVTFTDNSTPAGGITNWYWNFGDGTTENWTVISRPATGKASHVYAEGATYQVSLRVTNAASQSDEEVKAGYIVVFTTPKAVFVAAPAMPRAGTEVTFADSSTGDITKWTWDFGDGSSQEWTKDTRPADGRINHTFKKAGSYVATLTVSGTIKGQDVERSKNSQIEVSGPSGFHFSLWMVGAAVAVIVVMACVLYLIRARKAK